MWLIHSHCHSSNAIDEYWIFDMKEHALKKFRKMIYKNRDFLDMNVLNDIYEDSEKKISFIEFYKQYKRSLTMIDYEDCIHFTEDDYISLIDITEGFGRRP